jgi:hypothetical protein
MLNEHLSPVQGSQTTAPACCMCRIWRVASVRPATAAVATTNPSSTGMGGPARSASPVMMPQRVAVYLVTTDNSSGNHQVKYPYFTPVRRGRHNGIQPVVLPTPAGRSRVDLPPRPWRVARRPTPCAPNAPPTPSAPTPTLQRTPTLHRAHP